MPSNGALDIITGHCLLLFSFSFLSHNNQKIKRKDRLECGPDVPSERTGLAPGGTGTKLRIQRASQSPEPGTELGSNQNLQLSKGELNFQGGKQTNCMVWCP